MRRPAVLLLALALLAACAPFPELDTVGRDTATPPQLLPIDSLLAQAATQTPDPGPALAARAARLRVRAAAIPAQPASP
jgi:hypothetical protein